MRPLSELIATARGAAGMQAKRELSVLQTLGGLDGDDAAVLPEAEGFQLLCGEAILPALVERDPHGAGAAAVITNVSDIRAMGGRPTGLVDMLVSPDRAHAETVLAGLAWAAGLLGVPVVGGHLTIGGRAALSASCAGFAKVPLRASRARPGQRLLAAFCLDGRYHPDYPFFSSLRDRPAELLRTDGEALAEVAEAGLAHAARDVSMPGVMGSLLQMLEPGGLGAIVDAAALPRPAGVDVGRWLVTFPSFGYLLAAPPEHAEAVCDAFLRRGLACAICGELDDSGSVRLAAGDELDEVWDLRSERFTGLG
jgi:selenophosphate synthetase-related protein